MSIAGFSFGGAEVFPAVLAQMLAFSRGPGGLLTCSEHSDIRVSGAALRFEFQSENQHFARSDSNVLWLTGEVHSGGEAKTAVPKYILSRYLETRSLNFLSDLNGIFAGALVDADQEKIHIFCDRHGLAPLFWTVVDGRFCWSSAARGLLAMPGFNPIVRREAVDLFFRLGYLVETMTWFERVEMVPLGAVVTWDLASRSVSTQPYWWWDRIKLNTKISESEAVEELGRLFTQAVGRRAPPDERVLAMLSGGLDSRAIVAAAACANGTALPTITMGRPGSPDVSIATQVAARIGSTHKVVSLDAENWLAGRAAGIWHSDGHLDLQHMQVVALAPEFPAQGRAVLNGYFGDIIAGGGFMTRDDMLDQPLDPEQFATFTGVRDASCLVVERYQSLRKPDYFYLQNRRRFTYEGTRISETVPHRKPFFDNDFIDFCYSLPDWMRFRSRVYKKMLLRHYPELFVDIPWQKTGRSIAGDPLSVPTRAIQKLRRIIKNLGMQSATENRDFTDYPNWLRSEPARSAFTQLLGAKDALYRDYISGEQVARALEVHRAGRDASTLLFRAATFELWLQQSLGGKYRAQWP